MTEITRFRVLDFDCPTCASTIERSLSKVDGVAHTEVHYNTGRVRIEYDAEVADPAAFERLIENQGYTPRPR